MNSAINFNTTQENIHKYEYKIKKNKMCNKIKFAGQYTVDLNNNISRDVQEECANRLYRVYT